MQSTVLAGAVVVVGMRHEFLYFIAGRHVHFVDGRQVAIQDCTARDQEAGRIAHAVLRKITEGEEITQPFAARTPVLVEAGNGKQVGDVDLFDECVHLVDDFLHLCEPLGIDGRIGV